MLSLNLRPAPPNDATAEELLNYIAYLRQELQYVVDYFDKAISEITNSL